MHRFKLRANNMGCRCKVSTFCKIHYTESQVMHRSKLWADRVNCRRKVCTILRKSRQKVKRCIAPNFVPIELIDGTKFAPSVKNCRILFQSLRQYFIFRKWRKLWLFFPAAQTLCRWRKISLCGIHLFFEPFQFGKENLFLFIRSSLFLGLRSLHATDIHNREVFHQKLRSSPAQKSISLSSKSKEMSRFQWKYLWHVPTFTRSERGCNIDIQHEWEQISHKLR